MHCLLSLRLSLSPSISLSLSLSLSLSPSLLSFSPQANSSLYHNIAGQVDVKRTTEVVEEIFSECDIDNDGILDGYNEFISCWQLVETNEYVLFKFLREKSGMLAVYGVCGVVYAVEYASSESFGYFLSSWSDGRNWNLRARLAVALLEMIADFEDTPYGTLYLRDVHESNFGVVGLMYLDRILKKQQLLTRF